jgi:pimeloyl-ACP methyl ester carboxylesterase
MIDNPAEPLQGFSDYLKAQYGEANARATIQSFVGAARAIIDGGGDISLSRAGGITCPVLLIAGEHDVMAPPALASRLASHIHTVEMLEVEGAGHAVHDERPEWLQQTILHWLARAMPRVQ